MRDSLIPSSESTEHTDTPREMQGAWRTTLGIWFGQLVGDPDATTINTQARKPQGRPGYLITNKTAHRIAIKPDPQGEASTELIIAPFGSRELSSAEYQLYEAAIHVWVLRDLVDKESRGMRGQFLSPDKSGRKRPELLKSVLVAGAGVILLGIARQFAPLRVQPIVFGVGILLLGLLIVLLPQSTNLRLRAEGAIGRLLVPIAAFFVPTLLTGIAVYELGLPSIRSYTLALLWMLVLFAGVAAALPGALYFLFQRQRVNTLRQAFMQDIMRLCPITQTTEDVEQLYGAKLNAMYGCDKHGRAPLSTYIPICICTFLLSFGWCLVLVPSVAGIANMNQALSNVFSTLSAGEAVPSAMQSPLELVMVPSASTIGFGFLGAYFFALNFVFRRYVRADLGPKAYTHLSMRVLVAMILIWVIDQIAASVLPIAGVAPGSLLVSAFVIGIFPEWALTIVREHLITLPSIVRRTVPTLRDDLPLSQLQGITVYDRARLLEEGIENIENLAHHNIVALMLQTRIPTARLVDLMDQAILLLHVHQCPNVLASRTAGDPPKQPKGQAERDTLQRLGIRTATCLERAYEAVKGGDSAVEQEFLRLLNNDCLESVSVQRIARMGILLETIRHEEWMAYLRSWRDPRHFDNQPYGEDAFYCHTTRKPPSVSPALSQ